MTAWGLPDPNPIDHHVSCCSLPPSHSPPPPPPPPPPVLPHFGLEREKERKGQRTEHNRTEQNRTEQNRTQHNTTQQNRTEQKDYTFWRQVNEKAGSIPGLSRSPVNVCCCYLQRGFSKHQTHTRALAGAQHTSKAKSWKLHSADPPGMPNPTPLHPPSSSLGQGCLRAKSGNAPSAVLKTSSGFDNSAGWTSDHPDPGSLQASTARRRSESSQARLRKGVDLHAVQEPAAPPVGSSRLHTKVSCPCPPFLSQSSWFGPDVLSKSWLMVQAGCLHRLLGVCSIAMHLISHKCVYVCVYGSRSFLCRP